VAPNRPSPAAAWYPGDNWASDLPDWVRQPCLAYLKQRQRHWKPSQGQRHSQRILRALAHFWRWQLTQRPIADWTELSRTDLQAYIDQRLAQGRAPNTIKNVISPLTQLLHFLQAEQGLTFVPSLFRLQLPKARQSLPRHLNDSETHRLEALMGQKLSQDTPEARRDAAWFFVLAHTGLRLGELVDLRQDDLDLTGARLRIRQPKGRRDRIVYLSNLAVQALQRYLTLWPRQLHDPLFWHTADRPATYYWFQYQLHRLGQAAGVEHLSPHRLRHTFATRLINQGVPITTIQKLLGHRHLSSTQRYADVAETTVERDYRQAMAALMTNSLAPIPLVIALPLNTPAIVTNQFDNSV
jgi:integrase/recombinase XerC